MSKSLPKEQPPQAHQDVQSLYPAIFRSRREKNDKEPLRKSSDGRRFPQTAFPFVSVADLKYRPPEYIIDELLETDTLGLIFGEPGCGKSFLAVDIASSVASGTPFHGRTVKQGSVFFIAGEGHNGLTRRFAAWGKARGVPLGGMPLFISKRAAHFLEATSAKSVTSAVSTLADQHGPPALIIIDTLARNFGAGDENNTKDMSAFVAAVDEVKVHFPGAAVLVVHHSGHGEKHRARGAMALKGALDAEYRVEKDGHTMRLINTKMKDAEPLQDLFFTFRQVDLNGIAKSAVLDATDAPERQQNLSPSQRLAQTTYATAAATHGIWDDGAFRGVHVDKWRDAFYSRRSGDNTDAKQKAFQRVRKSMTVNGLMTEKDEVYLTLDANLLKSIEQQADGQDIAGHS